MGKIFIIVFCLIGTICKAQLLLGEYEVDIEGTYTSSSPVYEKWLDDEGILTMKFNYNPMGFKHALEEVEWILDKNNMYDAEPFFDDGSQGSDIIDDENPEEWHRSINKGNSEVRMGFLFEDRTILQIFLTSDGYELNIIGLD